MLYRIITEDINRLRTKALVSKHFDNFTIIEAIGHYKGISENTFIIEIDTFNENKDMVVEELCKAIRDRNKQECVLLQKINSNSALI